MRPFALLRLASALLPPLAALAGCDVRPLGLGDAGDDATTAPPDRLPPPTDAPADHADDAPTDAPADAPPDAVADAPPVVPPPDGALPAARDPVVFVHGCPVPDRFGGSGSNEGTARLWNKMYRAFRARGYQAPDWDLSDARTDNDAIPPPGPGNELNVMVFRHATCGSNLEYAREIDAFVDEVLAQTGAGRVDLVANSQGAAAARLYVLESRGRRVRDFVTLAGANHGSDVALVTNERLPDFAPPAYEGARELAPAYACRGESPRDVQYRLNGCLRTGEVVDETPFGVEDGGQIAYLSIYNPDVDELNQPPQTACLNQRRERDCSDPVNLPIQMVDREPHGNYRLDDRVIGATIAWVSRRNPS